MRDQREPPGWRRHLRFWGPDVEADIDDEVRLHLEMRERDFLARGLPPSEAREEALSRFGDVEEVKGWLRRHDLRQLRQERRRSWTGSGAPASSRISRPTSRPPSR